MKIWFVFNCLIIATVFRVANGTSCCRGQHDEGCYGNGLCDSECCNCQGGCNEYLRLSKCGWKTKAECALKVGQCALTCYDNGVTSSQCVSCFGGVYTKCVACLPGSLTADQVVNDTQSLIEVSSDKGKCGPMAWIECAVVVTGCAVSCIDPLDPLCIACLGPMYHKCAKCIHHKKTEVELLQNNTEVILQNYRNDFETTCQKSATQIWAQPENCCRGVHDKGCYGIGRCDGNCCNCDGGCNRYMMLSKCSLSDKIKCAAKVALCGKTCLKEGVKSANCIKCLGKVYKKCIGCIKGVEESLSGDQIVADSTEMVVAELGCSAIKWAKCGARLAICAASCVEPLDPLCAICMGKLFAKCKSCMSKHMDLQRLRMSTHEMVKERFSDFNGICKRETLVAGNCCKARHEDVCYGNGLCDGDCCNCQDGCNEYLVLSKCSWKQKLKCGVTVAKCASTCLKNGVISSQCKRCFGKLYKSCVQCLPTGLGAAAIVRGNQKMMEIRLGCNILECAVKIATCAAQCKNPISFGCVSCLGPAYDECKSCFFGDVNVMLHKNNTEELAKKHFKSSKSASFMIVPSQFMMGLFYLAAMSVYFIF